MTEGKAKGGKDRRFLRSSERTRGVALVLVLASITLVSLLALSFLSMMSQEARTSKGYAGGAKTRMLADSAVNIMMAQIEEACSQKDPKDATKNLAWVSQPGMIRTFDSTGSAVKSYKLYSSGQFVVDGAFDDGGKASPSDVPADWDANPDRYTDLNQPVASNKGVLTFPIVDPRAKQGLATDVKGFDYSDVVNGVVLPGGSANAQRLPMPVEWLYVLENGEIAACTDASGGKGVVLTGSSVSADNPVVARIAFWTDDETSKVNINTASEGVFWDMPRAAADEEESLGRYQPAQHEWSRYPGHPAMTSLSPVFPMLEGKLEDIYSVVPRVEYGGSLGGTTEASEMCKTDNDRLYASIDELIFDSGHKLSKILTSEDVDHTRFFISAHSRSPEVNLFNRPRVAMWPIPQCRLGPCSEGVPAELAELKKYRTVYDELIAHCATISGKPFYFLRADHFNKDGDFADYPSNQEVYDYLETLMSEQIPGYGGSFSDKYPDDWKQILTEAVDYIRSTNLTDDNLEFGYQYTEGKELDDSIDGGIFATGYGQSAPLQPGNGTMGFGRFYTVSEVAIVFLAPEKEKTLSGDDFPMQACFFMEPFSPMHGWTRIQPSLKFRITGLDSLQVKGGGDGAFQNLTFLKDGGYHSAGCVRLVGNHPMWGGTQPFSLFCHANGEDGFGPYPFATETVTIKKKGGETFDNAQFQLKQDGDITIEIYVDRASTGVGGQVAPADPAKQLIQTIHLKFPDTSILFPKNTSNTSYSWNPSPGHKTRLDKDKFNGGGKIETAGTTTADYHIQSYNNVEDSMRTLAPWHGDYRLVAASIDVKEDVFQPVHANYYDGSIRRVGTFRHGLGKSLYCTKDYEDKGGLVTGVNYTPDYWPDMPLLNDVPTLISDTRDWDAGMGLAPDGPFVNKPDEGAGQNKGKDRIPYLEYIISRGTQLFEQHFSPNRMIPSAGMLGSLPTGVVSQKYWRTLLFRPQKNHPADPATPVGLGGLGGPPDHLLMDLFQMPVVEPYAITDRLSTAGKINMNYRIIPFTYIERSTGLRAVFKAEKIRAISGDDGLVYKDMGKKASSYLYDIDVDETLKQFETQFDSTSDRVFKSESKICDLYLFPEGEGQTISTIDNWWKNDKELTADNVRERPYTTLYPRLATKSNTFTIHLRVQTLAKSKYSDVDKFDYRKDRITGEFRGSYLVERYLDPNLTDPGYDPYKDPINQYRFRIVHMSKFNP